MNAIQDIIRIMSYEDKQAFVSFLNRRNKRQDVLNISLFKSLETDDIELQTIVQKKLKSADAYHALRKRLYDSLIEFTGQRRFATDTSAEHEVLRLLVAAHVFFEHKIYKEAFKCLAKAEGKAIALEHFSLLNEIYHAHILYAHFDPGTNLDALIDKFKVNRKNMDKEEQMNIAYAMLRRELAEIYHNGKIIDFRAFIKDTMERMGVSPDALTYKSLYQILFIANEYASINSNYTLVEPFVEQAYNFIDSKEGLGDKNLYYHIYVLYLLANMHFRNRRFTDSEQFLRKMDEQMQKQGSRYYGRFCLRYFLLLALNRNYSGHPGAARDIVAKALKQNKDADETDINDLLLCQLMFYLQQSDRTAFQVMRHFGHTDSWYEKRMGMDWSIKKKLVEVLLHTEFGNSEIALSLLKSFRQRYKKYLLEVKEERVLAYTDVIAQYICKPESLHTPAFKNAATQFLPATQGGAEDVFVLSFAAWLKAKAEKRNVYEVILELMNN